VIDTYAPERVLIEPSGVGKLSDVLKAVENVAADLDVQVNSAVAVVDASKCKMYMKNFGEFFENQIEYAGTIILSRTDKVSQDKINAAVELIREHNTKATIITTPLAQLDGKDVLQTIEGADKLEDMMREMLESIQDDDEHHHDHEHEHDHEHHHDHEHEHDHEHHHDHDHDHEHEHHHDHGEGCSCGHDHHHADEVFTSWGVETPNTYTKEQIEHIFEELDGGWYGDILRAKGMVPAEDGTWIYYDYVPEEHEIRSGKPEVTGKICVIGARLREDKLAELFGAK
jgi:G3E family GTPase